jgi:type VI secretion system secreted protein VgrG
VYENAGAYAWPDSAEGERLAQQRMDERERRTQYFEASGNDRAAQPGRSFKLDGHFSAGTRPSAPGQPHRTSIGERDYLILSVLHTASNNYHAGGNAASRYENSFECVRQDRRWHPGRYYNSEPCLFSGVQTALVVGPAGDEIHTDSYGRVKIQFHWDRIGQYDAGGTPWTRVMMPMAGANLGQVALPRIGQEVVVQFLEGNMDHPIIIGAAYNADHQPPWKLPSQRALTGWRSRELNGGQRSNHLLLDDTSGQIQAQLRSDHLHSQLSLGHIVRVDDTSGRQDVRGEGFELRTDGHGVVRAAKGILLTTETRLGSRGGTKDMGATLQRLHLAAMQLRELADQAHAGGALESNSQQGAIADAVEAQNEAIKGAGSTHPELSAPHLVLSSPAGIEANSAKSMHIASAEHTAMTTGRSLSIAAGDGFFASIRETFRVFVQKAGMKLVAAAGKVTIQANSDDVEIIAQKVLTLISESDWVNIRGRKGVRLHGAESMLEIGERVQFFTTSPTLFHGNLETKGPKNQPQPEPRSVEAVPGKGQLRLALLAQGGQQGEAGVPYRLYKGGVMVEQSITDDEGCIPIVHEEGTTAYRLELPNGTDFEVKVHPRLAVEGETQHREHSLSNQGMRALDSSEDGRDHS